MSISCALSLHQITFLGFCRSYTGRWFPYIAATIAMGRPFFVAPITGPQDSTRGQYPHSYWVVGSISVVQSPRELSLKDLQLGCSPPGERPRNTRSDSPCETAASAGLRSARSAHCCPGDGFGWGSSPHPIPKKYGDVLVGEILKDS